MLTYKLINDRSDLCRLIWDAEQKAPQWYRDANAVWHPTFESFEAFWGDCREIYGLFDDETLVAVIYIEFLAADSICVHISVVGKVAERELVRFFVSVKDKKAIEGVTVITGWIASINRGMLRTGAAAGFLPTGLTMKYGRSGKKVLKWVQVRAI